MKRQTGRETIREIDRQAQIKAGMQRETQIYKNTDRQGDLHKDRLVYR
jgi:hypothetical protein